MSWKQIRLAATLVSATTVTLATGCNEVLEPLEPIQVAVLLPFSGQLGSTGPNLEKAALLAAEQVNAAGGLFDGRVLELVFADTETNSDNAPRLTADAIDSGAVAIIGPATSGGALKAAPIAADSSVPLVTCCATSPLLSSAQAPDDRWLFRTTPDDSQQAVAIAYLMDAGFNEGGEVVAPCTTASIIFRDDDYGAQFAPILRTEYERRGGNVPPGLYIPYDVPDVDSQIIEKVGEAVASFSAALTEIPDEESLCVVFISFETDGGVLVSQLETVMTQAARTGSHLFVGTDGTFSSAFAAQVGGTNVVGTAPTHSESDSYYDFKTAFEARFDAYAEGPPNFSWNTYDAVILTAVGIAQSRLQSGAALRDAIQQSANDGQIIQGGAFFGGLAQAVLDNGDINYVGPSGDLDFDENGDVKGDFLIWRTNNDTVRATGTIRAAEIPAP